MNNLNLIVMGKTGAGKSTLINAVLEEDLAPTGMGQAVTKKNQVYTKKMLLPLKKVNSHSGDYAMVSKRLNMYDTVGLEIDNAITEKTLSETKKFIQRARLSETVDDITMVWLCVSNCSNRLEPCEIKLIREISVDYEIPFMIVVTKCYTDEPGGLETQIRNELPEIQLARVLAKTYKTRACSVEAYGIIDLLQRTVFDYDKSKVKILEEKLDLLAQDRKERIAALKEQAAECIRSYSAKALKIGFVPGGCIPIVHGLCVKMITEVNRIVGINFSEGFAADKFADAVVGVIATPFMVVPLLSSAVAYGYVSSVGERYLDSLMHVVERSTDDDLKNNELMVRRIKYEINIRKEEV